MLALVFIIIFYGFLLLISAAISVIYFMGLWKIFKKAGEPGWKSLIPIYNTVTLLKVTKLSPLFALIYIIPVSYILLTILMIIFNFIDISSAVYTVLNLILFFVALATMAAALAFNVLFGFISYRLTVCFNQHLGFAFGLYFVPYVFYPIFGFSKNMIYTPYGENSNIIKSDTIS